MLFAFSYFFLAANVAPNAPTKPFDPPLATTVNILGNQPGPIPVTKEKTVPQNPSSKPVMPKYAPTPAAPQARVLPSTQTAIPANPNAITTPKQQGPPTKQAPQEEKKAPDSLSGR